MLAPPATVRNQEPAMLASEDHEEPATSFACAEIRNQLMPEPACAGASLCRSQLR